MRAKLKDARLSGRAGKDVLDNFNKATAEAMFDKEKNPMNLSKEELEAIKGEDGAIPGGLEPDEVFKLMNDPEVMAMVQKPKFQEIMADVMKGGGPMTLQKHMADPESREMLMTLTKLLQNAGMVPPGGISVASRRQGINSGGARRRRASGRAPPTLQRDDDAVFLRHDRRERVSGRCRRPD